MTKLRNVVVWVVLILAIVVAGLIVVPGLLGFQRYAIEGRSMEPTIPIGSVVFSKPADAADLVVGDIITYHPPPSSGVDDLVTHRIIRKTEHPEQQADNRFVFKTKGDANESEDPWSFTLNKGQAALEKAHLPYLGYVYIALSIPWVRILLITVPAVLIAVLTLVGLWRDAGRESEEERRRLREGGQV